MLMAEMAKLKPLLNAFNLPMPIKIDDISTMRNKGGIYLLSNNAIEYVGQTKNLFSRLAYHHIYSKWPYDIYFISCDESLLRLRIEDVIIKTLEPLHNNRSRKTAKPLYHPKKTVSSLQT